MHIIWQIMLVAAIDSHVSEIEEDRDLGVKEDTYDTVPCMNDEVVNMIRRLLSP